MSKSGNEPRPRTREAEPIEPAIDDNDDDAGDDPGMEAVRRAADQKWDETPAPSPGERPETPAGRRKVPGPEPTAVAFLNLCERLLLAWGPPQGFIPDEEGFLDEKVLSAHLDLIWRSAQLAMSRGVGDSGTHATRGYAVPLEIMAAVNAWRDEGIYPESPWVRAVLFNEVIAAVANASDGQLLCLPAVCQYVYDNVPAEAYGSAYKMRIWHGHCGRSGLFNRAKVIEAVNAEYRKLADDGVNLFASAAVRV